jgi:putative membrane-bound dehydrogenase-like protein
MQPQSPHQSLATLRTAGDMTVELVAAEPLVVDPVAIDFGPDGKLWVAEMHDYPSGVDGKYGPGGRVRFLEDSDGDGRYDKSTVFLDGIPFPTGVLAWRKGVLVCASSDVLYAEDSNGDGRADIVKKLLSGFATHNYQARVNSLEHGLDNWVYGSGGLFGGVVTSFAGKEPVALTSRDFRFKPDTGALEAAAGRTQQGRPRDDWGNWFGCDNSTVMRHYPLPAHYLARNPHLPPPSNSVYVPDYPDSNRLIPARRDLQLFKLSGVHGRVTAGCGLGIYRDDLLGPEYRGNAFFCEPVNLVVHRLQLTPRGVTFAGHRAKGEEQAEFLASTDNWFRPVQMRTGLDGAVYVVDMYRLLIEHPIWVPPDELAKVDVRAGHNLGRIYRVYPKGKPPRPAQRLDRLDATGLVAALDSPNGTQRDLAQAMLVWRRDAAGSPPLEQMARTSSRPEARLHALCALDGMGLLENETIFAGLRDSHAGVRRHAVRLAEPRLRNSEELADAVAKLVEDTDPQVRLQVIFTLGQWNHPTRTPELLAQVARKPLDVHEQAAFLSSLNRLSLAGVAAKVFDGPKGGPEREALAAPFLRLAAGYGDRPTLARMLRVLTGPRTGEPAAWQFAALGDAMEALHRLSSTPLDPSYNEDLREVVSRARAVVADDKAGDALRVAATRVLGHDGKDWRADVELLGRQLVPQNSAALQGAAVTTLGRINDLQVVNVLLARWKTYSPALRGQVLDVLLARPGWVRHLLDAMAKGEVPPGQLDATRRQRLLTHKDRAVRGKAEKLFAVTGPSDRKRLLDDYASVATLPGDRTRGKDVFARRCANCHRHENVGHVVGPDLGQMTNKTPQAVLVAILDPNQAIDERYVQYTAVTTDGRVHTGVLAAETATGVTLREQDGKETVLLRSQIEELQNTGRSMMPEGMEKDLSRQELADVIAYLVGPGGPPKQVAGNKPELVRADRDGALGLLATNGAIHGGDITYEPEYLNVGMWHGEHDHVVWTVEVPVAGDYDVYLDWSCDDAVAGNTFFLQGSRDSVRGQVQGTGGWSRYRHAKVGNITLPAGIERIVLRPLGPVKGALLDLRGLVLVPEGKEPPAVDRPKAVPEVARALLDDKRPQPEREALVKEHPEEAAALVVAMTADLKGDAKEEYRRIPWIWRVAVAAGRRNDGGQLRRLLTVSLPKPGEPLRDWQAVVIGGGVINGITQAGAWPDERVAELLKGGEPLEARWRQALQQAAVMADDEKVPMGTRYDALRMLGLDTWERRGKQLTKYLAKGVNDELQMGAVSALSDLRKPAGEVASALASGLGHYSKGNRAMALDALVRDEGRMQALLDAVEAGRIKATDLGPKHRAALTSAKDAAVRERAGRLLGK